MTPVKPKFAKLSAFKSSAPHILHGRYLNQVRNIRRSIARHGLFSPITVEKNGRRLTVIDGRKRLAALRRLQFTGQLSRGLVRVPYVLVNDEKVAADDALDTPLPLLSNAEKYDLVTTLRDEGKSLREIATALYEPKQFVDAMLKARNLSPRLKTAFFSGSLSANQVSALSVLPNNGAQERLLLRLGPFAKECDILEAIENGNTIIECPDNNIIILPSAKTDYKKPLVAA